ncbi:right-handed parallel beta-helix repeat-containing protein [Thioalkalicoccus limnaeus]|uniref:Right-handed parallel beta-helix repeat-containing protein n=1 Tax=Thioalkalicoccus limnaeus TaxID=120681 RepID=A0ABV4BHV6_9GAMM
MKGKISNFVSDKGYGFILDENNNNRFFHIKSVTNANDCGSLNIGDSVDFLPGQSTKGLTAENVQILRTPIVVRGRITNLQAKFGFIRDDNNENRFFHASSLIAPSVFDDLIVGDIVEFVSSSNEKGLTANAVRRIESHEPASFSGNFSAKSGAKSKPIVFVVDLANVYRGVVGGKFEQKNRYPLKEFYADLKLLCNAVSSYMINSGIVDNKSYIKAVKIVYDPRTFSDGRDNGVKMNKEMSFYDFEGCILTQKNVDLDVVAQVKNSVDNSTVCVFSGDSDIYNTLKISIPSIREAQIFFVLSQILFDYSPVYEYSAKYIKLEDLIANDESTQRTLKKIEDLKKDKPKSSVWEKVKHSFASPRNIENKKHANYRFKNDDASRPQQEITAFKAANSKSNAILSFNGRNNFEIVNKTIKCQYEDFAILLVNCANVSIKNVRVLNSPKACLRLINCRNITVNDCFFENSHQEQGVSISNSVNIDLKNVNCKNNQNAGIDIRDGSRIIQIENCQITQNSKAALRVTNSSEIKCLNSEFVKVNNGNGFWFKESSNIDISGCKLDDNYYSGFDIQECSDLCFTECSFSGNITRNGIRLKDVRNAKFFNCKFDNNKGFALDLNKSLDVLVLHCSLSNNTSGFADISEQSEVLIFNCSLSGEGRFKMRDRCYLRHNIKQGFISAIFSPLFDTDLTSRYEEIVDLPT